MQSKTTTDKQQSDLDAQSSFRVESELKKAVKEFATGFGVDDESWGWRVLAIKGLGDAAPNELKKKFGKLFTMIDEEK